MVGGAVDVVTPTASALTWGIVRWVAHSHGLACALPTALANVLANVELLVT